MRVDDGACPHRTDCQAFVEKINSGVRDGRHSQVSLWMEVLNTIIDDPSNVRVMAQQPFLDALNGLLRMYASGGSISQADLDTKVRGRAGGGTDGRAGAWAAADHSSARSPAGAGGSYSACRRPSAGA